MVIKKSPKILEREANIKDTVKNKNSKVQRNSKDKDLVVDPSKDSKKEVKEVKSEGTSSQHKKRSRECATTKEDEEPQFKRQKKTSNKKNNDGNRDGEERQIAAPKQTKDDETSVQSNNLKYLTCKDATVKKDLLLKQERDKRCLVVRNLRADTTPEDLKASSDDILEVRVQTMKSKKAEGRKLAFVEFQDEASCKSNLESIGKFLAEHQREAVVGLAEREPMLPADLAFDPLRLFVKGLQRGCHKSQVEALFPSSASVDGTFGKDGGTLENDHVVVSFADAKECLRVKDTRVTFKGHDLSMEFMRAGKRQCRRAAKKAMKISKNEKKKKQKKLKDDKSQKDQNGQKQPNVNPEKQERLKSKKSKMGAKKSKEQQK